MLVGYARTSTVDQKAGLEAQVAELKATGCEELFVEQVSSVQRREELEKALNFIRKGDTLVITKLDRLGPVHPRPCQDHWDAWRRNKPPFVSLQ